MFAWLKRIFDRSADPVHSCDLYRDKEAGSCAHVDGPLCDFPECSMLADYRRKRRREMTAPIKTCDYCGATGEMPTFMNGETICYTCMSVLPKTLPEARQELMRLRAVLAVVTQPAPSVPDGWKEAAIAWEVCASIHREYGKGKDPFFNTRQGDFVKHANDARAMLAAAPEAKP